jgi:FlaA1/EpsC-like NDP-sugar epimerase
VSRIVGLDNNESAVFFLDEHYRDVDKVQVLLGDIRDRDSLDHYMRGIDIVIHAAAFKHVRLCERAPTATVQVNILGLQNLIEVATTRKVERVLFTSSDKAVNPTNVMGTSKLMGERLITAADSYREGTGPLFMSTRFGNVLGSRGSVIPLFRKQIAAGGPVTLTDDEMTRFIMSLSEAVRLVTQSVFLATGGEVFVTKMPVVRIRDLAEVLIEEFAPRYGRDPRSIEVQCVGAKPGEKMYEELLTDEETRRSLELQNYFVVLPAFSSSLRPAPEYPGMRTLDQAEHHGYNSGKQPALTHTQLRAFLKRSRLLEELDEE